MINNFVCGEKFVTDDLPMFYLLTTQMYLITTKSIVIHWQEGVLIDLIYLLLLLGQLTVYYIYIFFNLV